MQNIPLIEFLKYKISYGTVGEQDGVGYYPGLILNGVTNLNDTYSITEQQVGNPDLTWEKSNMFQTGLEFSIGKYVDGSIDYYSKTTKNLLFERRVGPSVGYAYITVNEGLLRNSGLEFDLTAHLIQKGDFTLDLTLNGEMPKNTLLEMPIDPATDEQKILDIAGRFGRSKGHSLLDFYIREWAGVDPADGTAMWYLYYFDENGNGVADSGEGIASLTEYTALNPTNEVSVTTTKNYADATLKYVDKSAFPKVRGAFRLEGTYKNFDFAAQFLYSLGGYAYDAAYAILMSNDMAGGNNWSTDILDRWQQPGDITNVPRLSSNYDINVNASSTRFLTKTDYLTLNNIRVGYNLPKRLANKIGMSSLNIFVSGDNLFLLSARNGFNPSTDEAGTSDMYRYTPLTTYTAGIRVKF